MLIKFCTFWCSEAKRRSKKGLPEGTGAPEGTPETQISLLLQGEGGVNIDCYLYQRSHHLALDYLSSDH